ncbi:hypothetical protein FKM82_000487 [Ascaphus truei]
MNPIWCFVRLVLDYGTLYAKACVRDCAYMSRACVHVNVRECHCVLVSRHTVPYLNMSGCANARARVRMKVALKCQPCPS